MGRQTGRFHVPALSIDLDDYERRVNLILSKRKNSVKSATPSIALKDSSPDSPEESRNRLKSLILDLDEYIEKLNLSIYTTMVSSIQLRKNRPIQRKHKKRRKDKLKKNYNQSKPSVGDTSIITTSEKGTADPEFGNNDGLGETKKFKRKITPEQLGLDNNDDGSR